MKRPSMHSSLVALALVPLLGQPLMAASPMTAAPIPSPRAIVATAGLGDLTPYKTITSDTLALVKKGDMAGAQKRGTDLETAWDKAEDTMKPGDPARWRVVDKAIDRVLNELRAPKPQAADCAAALTDLLGAIDKGGAA